MSFASSTAGRFTSRPASTPGPGAYYSNTKSKSRAPPSAGSSERSGWLRGSMGTSSYAPRVSNEGFVGNQKDLSSPGPGAYSPGQVQRAQTARTVGFSASAARFQSGGPSGSTPYRAPDGWGARNGSAGFNSSDDRSRDDWLSGEVGGKQVVSGSSLHYVGAQHPSYLSSPGPGAYDYSAPRQPVAKMGTDQRFRTCNRNGRVGPGSYHSWAPTQAIPAAASTHLERDSWLKGAAGGHSVVSGSASHHVDKQRRLQSPGPGSYEASSAFSRAMSPNLHQVSLETRAMY